MCVYHAICICSYTGSAYISGSISIHSDLLYNLSLATTLTLSAIVLHQDEHSIVLGQGPTTQKQLVQKRPAGAVMKKPAAWSVKPATGSASSIAKRPSPKVLKKPAAGSAKAATASIVKRPSAKVLNKPAAGSVARNYNSPPISVLSGSSIDDATPLSALTRSSCATTPTRAPLVRTLTVQTTEPYELEEGVDYSSAGTPSSTLSSEMNAQLRRMGWAR